MTTEQAKTLRETATSSLIAATGGLKRCAGSAKVAAAVSSLPMLNV